MGSSPTENPIHFIHQPLSRRSFYAHLEAQEAAYGAQVIESTLTDELAQIPGRCESLEEGVGIEPTHGSSPFNGFRDRRLATRPTFQKMDYAAV